MTEAEVVKNFAAVLERVNQGAEVIVDRDNKAVALIRSAAEVHPSLSELIQRAKHREIERGYEIRLDDDFTSDVQSIIQARKPWLPRPWD